MFSARMTIVPPPGIASRAFTAKFRKNKYMNKIKSSVTAQDFSQEKPLIEINSKGAQGIYVPISHGEVDHLLGSLLHLMDLNSDVQFREAMKSEIKQRVRQWLDNEYSDIGYRNYGYVDGAKILVLEEEAENDRDKTTIIYWQDEE